MLRSILLVILQTYGVAFDPKSLIEIQNKLYSAQIAIII